MGAILLAEWNLWWPAIATMSGIVLVAIVCAGLLGTDKHDEY